MLLLASETIVARTRMRQWCYNLHVIAIVHVCAGFGAQGLRIDGPDAVQEDRHTVVFYLTF